MKGDDVILETRVPRPFNLLSTTRISGWGELAPFKLKKQVLSTVLRLETTGNIVQSSWMQNDADTIKLKLSFSKYPTREEIEEAKNQISVCLRLDEDYGEFYETCSKSDRYDWVKKLAAGRILRAPTVFEDTVKTICTTNCSWPFSIIMARNLCSFLGEGDGVEADVRPFPTPSEVVDAGEPRLREIKMGYRSSYIFDMAKRVLEGNLNLEAMRDGNLSIDEVTSRLRSIKGLGRYSVAYMLNFLGHFEYLTIDRWMRKKYFEKYTKGRVISDDNIVEAYEKFGKWKGLFFWVDMTKEWLGA